MLILIISTPSCEVYICPVQELNKHFPGDIVARLLNPDDAIVISSHDSHAGLTENYFIVPGPFPK